MIVRAPGGLFGLGACRREKTRRLQESPSAPRRRRAVTTPRRTVRRRCEPVVGEPRGVTRRIARTGAMTEQKNRRTAARGGCGSVRATPEIVRVRARLRQFDNQSSVRPPAGVQSGNSRSTARRAELTDRARGPFVDSPSGFGTDDIRYASKGI